MSPVHHINRRSNDLPTIDIGGVAGNGSLAAIRSNLNHNIHKMNSQTRMSERQKLSFNFSMHPRTSACLENPCPACSQASTVEQRVIDAAENLNLALSQLRHVRSQHNVYNDTLAKLPTEIVTHVFKLTLPLMDAEERFHTWQWSDQRRFRSYDNNEEDHAIPFQFTLGSVCQAWRNIVQSTPFLWDFFSLKLYRTSHPSILQTAQEWLTRSAGLPLGISLSISTSPYEGVRSDSAVITDILNPLIDTLNDAMPRWSIVLLRIPDTFISKFQTQQGCVLPLKALVLHPLPEYLVWPSRIHLLQNELNPTFCTSSNNGDHPVLSPSYLKFSYFEFKNISIAWSKLTHLNMTVFNPVECMEALNAAPQLVVLQAGEGKSDPLHSATISQFIPPSILVHTSLTTLELHSEAEWIIERLSCPSLNHLALSLRGNTLAGVPTDFILRSGCQLYSLNLRDPLYGDEALIPFLTSIPTLTMLTIGICVATEFFTYLGASAKPDESNASVFLPNLEELTYRGIKCFPWDTIWRIAPSLQEQTPLGSTHRPLRLVRFMLDLQRPGETITADEEVIRFGRNEISFDDLRRFVKMRETIHLEITMESGTDVLGFWIDHYGGALYLDDDGSECDGGIQEEALFSEEDDDGAVRCR